MKICTITNKRVYLNLRNDKGGIYMKKKVEEKSEKPAKKEQKEEAPAKEVSKGNKEVTETSEKKDE